MQDTTRKKRGAMISAMIIALLFLSYLGLLSYVIWIVGFQSIMIVVLILYGLVVLAAIFGVLYAMRQRFKELNSGEEEEAKKY